MNVIAFFQKPFLNSTRHHPRGGAAIEYIIVSTFALLMAVGAVVFVSRAVHAKMAKIEEKLGVTFESDALDLFK